MAGSTPPSRLLRGLAMGAAVAGVLGLAGLLAVGEVLSHPSRETIGPPPGDLQAQAVRIGYSQGESVAGWFTPGRPGGGVVLLLHGVRSSRLQMVPRARFLHAAGYGVLLIDLPAHGESSGARITFGARESAGVTAALAWLRAQAPGERVGVIGVSLGAASLVLARPQPEPDAVALESMFPTIEEAVGDRIASRLGPSSRRLVPLLLWQLPMRTGVQPAQLRPIEALPELHVPLLIAAGTLDRSTTWPETERLYAAAGAPKQLWPVAGAGHVDLCDYAPAEYQSRLLAFLGQHLR